MITELTLWSFATNLVWLGLLLGFVRLALMWFDKISGVSFKEWYENASSHDRGIYFSVRIASVFIAAALSISPPV